MSRKPLVAGWKGASFKGVDFGKYVTRWDDSRQPSVVVHRYNKRDGGEAEYMGRKPHEARIQVCWIGKTWRDDFLKLQAAIDEDPVGDLVHPVYGSMRAACLGHQGASMDMESSPNLYEVAYQFIESAVDTKVSSDSANDTQSAAEQQQRVTRVNAQLAIQIASFASAATSVAALSTSSTAFAAAAVASSVSSTVDVTLPQQLAAVLSGTDVAIAAIMADPLAVDGAVTATAVTLCEELYDACIQIDNAIRAAKPTVFLYTVPMRMHITNLARIFYGKDGAAREAEILANNPRKLPNPGSIPPGTQLLMAAPTV
jgi:hypothetical protein